MRYYIKIRQDSHGNITLTSPDLPDGRLQYNPEVDQNTNYRKYIINTLTECLANNEISQNPVTPNLDHGDLLPTEHWEMFNIVYDSNLQLFAILLPKMGQVSAILTILSNAVITFMSFNIATHKQQNTDKDNQNIMSSAFAALLTASISLLMYFYSDATSLLQGIGKNIDATIFKPRSEQANAATPRNNVEDKRYLKSLIRLLAFASVLTNVAVAGVSANQSCILVVKKFLELNPSLNTKANEELLLWLVVRVFIVSGAYKTLAFQGSFVAKPADKLFLWLAKRPVNAARETNQVEGNNLQAPLLVNNRQTNRSCLIS